MGEEGRRVKKEKRSRMRKNEEVVDRLNAKYHWMEQQAEEHGEKKKEDKALKAQQNRERMIKERQEKHTKLVEQRKNRVQSQSQAADEARQLSMNEAKMSANETAERDAAAEKLQAVQRGKQDREKVAEMKKESGDSATGGDDGAADEEAAEEAAKTVKLDFVVQLDQPLGMKIDHVEGHDTWPAEITAVVPDSQASKAGIVPGMYVVGMNGESTEGKTLDDVVQGVIAAKTEQTPLTMNLQLN